MQNKQVDENRQSKNDQHSLMIEKETNKNQAGRQMTSADDKSYLFILQSEMSQNKMRGMRIQVQPITCRSRESGLKTLSFSKDSYESWRRTKTICEKDWGH